MSDKDLDSSVFDNKREDTGRSVEREFPTEVIASLSTGVLLCDFSAMHECAEFLMGHPIWTHHFANEELWQAMRRAILAQRPGMPTEMAGVNADNYRERVADLNAAVGPTQRLRKGDGSTAMSPLDGIPKGNPVIAIEV
jgi:hypothetical protein